MKTITIRIPDELHREIKKMEWINWSKLIVKMIKDFIFKSKEKWSIEEWRKYFGIEAKEDVEVWNYEEIRKVKEARMKFLKKIEE